MSDKSQKKREWGVKEIPLREGIIAAAKPREENQRAEGILLSDWTLAAVKQREEDRRSKAQVEPPLVALKPREEEWSAIKSLQRLPSKNRSRNRNPPNTIPEPSPPSRRRRQRNPLSNRRRTIRRGGALDLRGHRAAGMGRRRPCVCSPAPSRGRATRVHGLS